MCTKKTDMVASVVRRTSENCRFKCPICVLHGLEHTDQTLESQHLRKWRCIVVRVKITLECTDCKQRNYNMMKDKKAHPERMETKKYCRFCKTHTLHKETK